MEITSAVAHDQGLLRLLSFGILGMLVGLLAGTLAAEVPEEAMLTGWETQPDGSTRAEKRWSHDQLAAIQITGIILVVAGCATLGYRAASMPHQTFWLAAAFSAIPPFLLMGL